MPKSVVLTVILLLCATGAHGQVVIETVTVGNPGNAGEWSGESYGGYGPDRICGAVGYVYGIGRFEVTTGKYTEFLNAVAATDTYGLYNASMNSDEHGCQITQNGTSGNFTYDFSGRPSGTEADWVDRPVNYVSWGDAARFCNWLHNGQPGLGAPVPQDENSTEDGSYFLNGAMTDLELQAIVRTEDATWVIPSEDEWYKAAYHYSDGVTGNYWDYPTESNTAPTSEAPAGTDMTNGSANCYSGGYVIGSPYYRTEVGAYDAKPSDSPYATFDQGGNVWEWNEAVIYGSYRGLRGGSFSSYDYDLHAALRDTDDPTDEDYGIGFRVATFVDCNDNGIPDECDLECGAMIGLSGGTCSELYPGPACGLSDDDNGDGIPDDCGACCGPLECFQVPEATCASLGDYRGDGTTCETAECSFVPTVSEWGLVAMALLVLSAGTVVMVRRRVADSVVKVPLDVAPRTCG